MFGLFLIRVEEPKFFQLVTQGVAGDIKEARGVSLIAVGLAHGDLHHGALDFFERSAAFRDVEPGQAAAVGQLLAAIAGGGALKYGEPPGFRH